MCVSACVWGQVVLIRRRAAIAVFTCVCVLHWLPEWVRAVRCVEFGGGGGVWRLPCVGVCVCGWVNTARRSNCAYFFNNLRCLEPNELNYFTIPQNAHKY